MNHAKVDFEDIRFDFAGFKPIKEQEGHKFEFGQVPVIETPEGETYAQSNSIMRLLG